MSEILEIGDNFITKKLSRDIKIKALQPPTNKCPYFILKKFGCTAPPFSRPCNFSWLPWVILKLYLFQLFFRQHAASIYGFVHYVCMYVCYVCVSKKFWATSKQGRRLRFGMLTVLTNIRSTKVLHHTSCIMHHRLLLTKVEGWDSVCWLFSEI